jgi:hypothetical protein
MLKLKARRPIIVSDEDFFIRIDELILIGGSRFEVRPEGGAFVQNWYPTLNWNCPLLLLKLSSSMGNP